MIRTLSSALSSSTTKEKQKSPLLGRLTMNSLTNRLSNSTKHFVARIPQHQKDFENFRKRAQNLFTSNVEEKIDLNSNSLDNSSEVFRNAKQKKKKVFFIFFEFRSSASMRFIDVSLEKRVQVLHSIRVASKGRLYFKFRL